MVKSGRSRMTAEQNIISLSDNLGDKRHPRLETSCHIPCVDLNSISGTLCDMALDRYLTFLCFRDISTEIVIIKACPSQDCCEEQRS